MNSVMAFSDPFKASQIYRGADLAGPFPGPTNPHQKMIFDLYKYYARNSTRAAIGGRAGEEKPSWYIIGSAAPDGIVTNLNDPLTARTEDNADARAFFSERTIYDASNGTISNGDVYRVGGTPAGAGSAFYYVAEGAK